MYILSWSRGFFGSLGGVQERDFPRRKPRFPKNTTLPHGNPKTPKNPKKPHFYPPPKKWVPTPKNSPEGRPPNPILGGGGGVNQSLIRGGFLDPPGSEKTPTPLNFIKIIIIAIFLFTLLHEFQ